LIREFYDVSAVELVQLRNADNLNDEGMERLAELEKMFRGDEDLDWDTPLFEGDPEFEEWERSHLKRG
jgi:hypothetical protein